MTFDAETGIVYDTLFYGVLFFNFERIREHYDKWYSVIDDDFDYFFALKKSITPPEPELYPFFYYDSATPSFMATTFISSFKFGIDSFPEYMKRLRDYKDEFKKSFLSYLLGKETDELANNNECIANEILKQKLDSKLAVSILYLLFNYETVFDSFESFICAAYKSVKKIHAKNASKIRPLVEKYSTENFINKVAIFDAIKPSPTLANDKMSVCLLNYLVVMNKGNPETGNYYIFGRRCEDFLTTNLDYQNIDPRLLFEALGHPIKAAILQKLKEKEFTATQLSVILFASRQAINTHLLWMLDYMFIEIARRNKAEIYYRVNRDFFEASKNIYLKFADEFTKLKGDERIGKNGYY